MKAGRVSALAADSRRGFGMHVLLDGMLHVRVKSYGFDHVRICAFLFSCVWSACNLEDSARTRCGEASHMATNSLVVT